MSATIGSIIQFPTCPEHLTPDQVEQYHRDGFLAFTDVLSPDEVEQLKADLRALLDRIRQDHVVMSSSYGMVWKLRAGQGSAQFEKGHEPTGPEDPDLDLKVRKFTNYVGECEYSEYLATSHGKIQGILSGLIGDGPALTQNVALVKPPFYGSEKPWHQDDAYFSVAPLEAVCGVWIALDEATVENGCMHVLPGAHKLGALKHIHGADCEIDPGRLVSGVADLRLAAAIPLPPGGALFFSGVLPHQTPANTTPMRRRALQLHYRSRDSQVLTGAEYDTVFVEADGTPASCVAAARRGF